MSTHITAFIPDTDETYQKHKKVLLACLEAEVELPEKTAEYFGGYKYPELCYLDEKLTFSLKEGEHYRPYRSPGMYGFEIDLDKIPKEVKTIRFYNSY